MLATSYGRWERGLSLVLVTINAIIGGSIFTSISDSPLTIYLQVFAGVLSLVAAVLTAWKTELKWAERSEGHRNAARGFEKISHRFVHQLDMIQVCPVDNEGKLLKEWSEIIQAWEDLESESPHIPAAVYDKWDKETQHRQIGRESIYISINELESGIKAKGNATARDQKMLDRLKKLDKNQDGILEVHELLSTIYHEAPPETP